MARARPPDRHYIDVVKPAKAKGSDLVEVFQGEPLPRPLRTELVCRAARPYPLVATVRNKSSIRILAKIGDIEAVRDGVGVSVVVAARRPERLAMRI